MNILTQFINSYFKASTPCPKPYAFSAKDDKIIQANKEKILKASARGWLV